MSTELAESAEGTEPGELANVIRALYKNNVRLFTKRTIQNMMHQIHQIKLMIQKGEPTEGQTFLLEGLDGRTVKVDIKTDLVEPDPVIARRHSRMLPTLDYQAYQHLIRQAHSTSLSANRAYCPLQICYTSMEHHEQMSVELTREAFDAGFRAWKVGETCQSLRLALETTTLPGPITKIIAFANSGISSEDEAWRSRSIVQHSLMLVLRDFINSCVFGVEVKCFAQDPVYTEADKVVLQEAGIAVLDDPRGFLEVDDESVVISFAPNIPVRQIVTDLARPAILIWNTIHDNEADAFRYWASKFTPPRSWVSLEHLNGHLCDPESPRVCNMIQEKYFDIAKLDESNFGNASVYVRRR